MFSYPEKSTERNQLEPRTFDFTHILTNIRNQILTRGFDYCKKQHFEELCIKRPDILSIALVYNKIDTQNAFTAMKMFNYSVELWLKQNGFRETANFARLRFQQVYENVANNQCHAKITSQLVRRRG